jgi:hypothetical protein
VRLAPGLLALALLPAIPVVQLRIDQGLGDLKLRRDVLYLWSGAHVKRLAPGFENLLADIYWLRTVQYFGGQRLFSAEKRFELLHPLIEITTSLDPRLEIAYRLGAIFLCEPWPVGKGDPENGIRILEKGVRALPRSWRLRQDLGYFRFVFLNDAEGGASILHEAAKLPGAPFWLETLAGSILVKGGERQSARAVWTRMFEQAEDGAIRDNARYNLERLDGLDALDQLDALVRKFQEEHARPPAGIQEVLAQGVDRRLLVDRAGVPFEYDVVKGRFWFGQRSRLWRSK